MRKLHNLIALALLAVSVPLAAAPCAGFTDVDDTSPFCPSVEWMTNRAITTGCAAGLFCPTAPVSRLAQAAFLQRAGGVLSTTVVMNDASIGALDLDTPTALCQSGDIAISGYPRTGLIDGMVSATASEGIDLLAALVKSTDAGANWTPVGTGVGAMFVPPSGWANVAALGALDLHVGDTVRFGIAVTRAAAGSTDLVDARCQLRVSLHNRNGSASPF